MPSGAKTVWQLAYAGSVGSQMLLGLPALKRLTRDPRIAGRTAIWPFETGLRTPGALVAIAEVYPSLLSDEVRARQRDGEILDSAQVRVNAEAFARLDAGGGLAPLFAGAPCPHGRRTPRRGERGSLDPRPRPRRGAEGCLPHPLKPGPVPDEPEFAMRRYLNPLAILSLLFSGAIFGFFYAWVCSTMWGLDAADPNIAIAAMQAMNASVRNAAFAPAFFGTPLILLLTALVSWRSGEGRAALLFGAGGLLYLLGALLLTVLVHSPMNDGLALVETPLEASRAQAVWQDYSAPWQSWNTVRAIVSCITLLLAGLAILNLNRAPGATATSARSTGRN